MLSLFFGLIFTFVLTLYFYVVYRETFYVLAAFVSGLALSLMGVAKYVFIVEYWRTIIEYWRKRKTFGRGRALRPAQEPRTVSAKELMKIIGTQERIRKYGSASNWMIMMGFVLGLAVTIYLIITEMVSLSYAILVFLLIYIPFIILSGIFTYYKYKLQRKLDRSDLT